MGTEVVSSPEPSVCPIGREGNPYPAGTRSLPPDSGESADLPIPVRVPLSESCAVNPRCASRIRGFSRYGNFPVGAVNRFPCVSAVWNVTTDHGGDNPWYVNDTPTHRDASSGRS